MSGWRVSVAMLGAFVACTTSVVDPGGPDGGPRGSPLVSPPGFFHLPHPTTARTLFLRPDGVVRLWMEECDSIGLAEATWHTTGAGTAEIVDGTSTHAVTFLDGGTLLVDPPLFVGGATPAELWPSGAVCSVCYSGWPMAVVRCTTPDAGLVSACCAGGCGGATPAPVSCTFGLRAGDPATADAVAAGTCSCPAGSVRAADCSDSPTVFCGGPALRPGDVCCAGGCNGDVNVPVVCDGGTCSCPEGSVSPADCENYPRRYCSGAEPGPLGGIDAGH